MTRLFVAALAGLALVAARPAAAAPSAVSIDVQIISASTKAGPTDPRLAKLQKRLTDFAFASYRLVSEKRVLLRLHSEETMALPGRRTLEITPRRFEPSGKLRVHLHLNSEKNEKLIDAEYAIEPGGDLLVGGPRDGDDTLLVVIHHG